MVREMCKAPDLQAIGLGDLEVRIKEQAREDSRAKQVMARLKVLSFWAQQRSIELSPDSQIAAANVLQGCVRTDRSHFS